MTLTEQPVSTATADPEISGKWVILFLFLFGATMTGSMWIYWKMHLAPFLPLQQAIVSDELFEESRPVVEGGREKGKAENPNVLRITMKIDFDPESEPERIEPIQNRLLELSKTRLPHFAEFDLLEVNLYWPKQESELSPITTQLRIPLKEGVAVD